MKTEAPKAYELHQKLKIGLGNRKSASHSKSNLNVEMAAIAGTNLGFTTDLGCRYRCSAGNAQALLLNEEDVKKVAKLRTTDHIERLDSILSDEDSNETTNIAIERHKVNEFIYSPKVFTRRASFKAFFSAFLSSKDLRRFVGVSAFNRSTVSQLRSLLKWLRVMSRSNSGPKL